MRHFAISLLWGCMLISPAPAAAQDVVELTLEEAVRRALEANPSVRAARAEFDQAESAYRVARSAMLPNVRSGAGYTRLSENVRISEITLPGSTEPVALFPMVLDQVRFELAIEQPLFTGGRLRNQARAAEREAEAAEWALEAERVDLAFEVRRAYWTLYAALEQLDAIDAALAHVDAHLADVNRRLDAGAALESDRLAAEARRAEVLLDRLGAENAVRLATLDLNRWIGLPLDSPVRLADAPDAETATPPGPTGPVPESAPTATPLLRALEARVLAREAQLRAAVGLRFPEVGAFGRYLLARPNPYFIAEQDQTRGTWEIGLSMNVGLWDSGRRGAETSLARAGLEAAEAQLAAARDAAAVEVERWRLTWLHAAEAVDVAAQAVRAAEASLDVARQQYAEGVALSEQVLSAEQAYRAAELRRARAAADLEIARAGYLHAQGRVW